MLIVSGTRFREVYQRIYFKDVQALIVRRKARFVMQWPYLVLALALLIAAARQPILRTFPFLIGGIGGFALLMILPTRLGCYLDIATAVGNVSVPSVGFTWTANRFLSRVSSAILAAQQEIQEPRVPA